MRRVGSLPEGVSKIIHLEHGDNSRALDVAFLAVLRSLPAQCRHCDLVRGCEGVADNADNSCWDQVNAVATPSAI